MKNNKDSFDRNLSFERKDILPVKCPNQKMQQTSGGKIFVKCISTMPLAVQTSKQQIRINYVHGMLQGKISDPRYNNLLGPPKVQMQPNHPFNNNENGQRGTNPFIKNPNTTLQQAPMIPTISNGFSGGNLKGQNGQNYNNTFGSKQFQNNNPHKLQSPINNMLNNIQQNSTLTRQTSFGDNMAQGTISSNPSYGFSPPSQNGNPLISNPSTNLLGMGQQTAVQHPVGLTGDSRSIFPGSNITQPGFQANPLNSNVSKPFANQLNQSPSFGNLNSQSQQTTWTMQTKIQVLSSTISGPQNTAPLGQNSLLNNNSLTQNTWLGGSLGQAGSANAPTSKLDQNIKQLLQSKPNLWNILALDPNYKNGFNEAGRMYCKSVLQRIIDQNILSEDSLNKIVVQTYKQMYGAQNFQKVLQSKKKQSDNYYKKREFQIDRILSKQYQKLNSESVFPKDFKEVGEDFYRSSKRTSAKILDSTFHTDEEQNSSDQHVRKMQRKYYQIKRSAKKLQLKVKFVEYKVTGQRGSKTIQNPYSEEHLSQISSQIHDIRVEHRKSILPTYEDLPNIEGFQIAPSVQDLSRHSKMELMSVAKVMISNEWGSIKFKAPISLLRKNISEGLVLNQKSVQISDQEWKVRDAEITFRKFADFQSMSEDEQNQLQQKIVSWCQKQSYELVSIDKENGTVVIEV